MATERHLIIPDCHLPFHDKRAFNLMLAGAKKIGISGIVILGDFVDNYGASCYEKSPRVKTHLKQEIAAGRDAIAHLDELFPKTERLFIMGNHEHRLETLISSKCPELFDFVSMQELLRLDNYGWKTVAYGPDQLARIGTSKLYARHTPLAGGQMPALNTAIRGGCSIVFGHVHRIQDAQVVTATGETYRSFCPGWLGRKDHTVFDYVQYHHQWSLGFSLCEVTTGGNYFAVTCPIINYAFAYGSYIQRG